MLFSFVEDPAAIELGYGGGPIPTPVVETDDYVEIMDDETTDSPVGRNIISPQVSARAQVLSPVRRRTCVPPILGRHQVLRVSKVFPSKSLSRFFFEAPKGRRLLLREIH